MMEQGTEEWFAARLGKVTASKISNVMMSKTTAGYQNYRAQLICERLTGNPTESFQSPAMAHGTETEPQARAVYTMNTGNNVDQIAFVPHPKIAEAGASPDGLIGDDGLLEIKCPQPATHIKTLTGSNIDRKYILQMQWQMVCTGRYWCDFVSFCPSLPPEMQLHCERVTRDVKLCAEISESVQAFIADVQTATEMLTEKYKKEAA